MAALAKRPKLREMFGVFSGDRNNPNRNKVAFSV